MQLTLYDNYKDTPKINFIAIFKKLSLLLRKITNVSQVWTDIIILTKLYVKQVF